MAFFNNKKNSIKKVVTGSRNSLVLLDNGEIYAFGDNSEGQSTGLATRYLTPTLLNLDLSDTDKIVDLEIGNNHVISMTESGKIYLWGSTDEGKLGLSESNSFVCNPKLNNKLIGSKIFNFYAGKHLSIFICN